MSKTFVDTSFSVAFVSERDLDHKIAIELSDRFEGSQLLTTDCVLLEIGNSLAGKYREQAVDTIGYLSTSREVEVVSLNSDLFSRAFDLYQSRMDKSWGMVDCVSFVVMRERGIVDALTSDRHFVQAGFNALML